MKLRNPRLKTVRNSDTVSARATKQQISAERNERLRDLVAEIESESDTPMSMATIAEAMNTAGYTTARGKQFTKTQVHRIKKAPYVIARLVIKL